MSFRSKTLLWVTLLLVGAVLSNTALLARSARQNLLDQQAADGLLIASLLSRTTGIVDQFPVRMEQSIAEQMVVEAALTAHLVAIAERAGLTPQEINAILQDITAATVLEEFWITDERGRAYLHNIPDVDFTFSPDPAEQPQASAFWPLLTGERKVVVQDAQRRELDGQFFKYVGVGGVDKPRIVQVGYNYATLDELRQSVGVARLVEQLIASGEISAIRVVTNSARTRIFQTGTGVSDVLTEQDVAKIAQAVASGQPPAPYVEGNVLKVVSPVRVADQADVTAGAIVVYLSTERVQKVVRDQVANAAGLAAVVLAIGISLSLGLSRLVTEPVEALIRAAQAVTRGEYKSARFKSMTDRRDELGELGRVFDQMAREVSARDRRLSLLRAIIPAGVAMSAEKDFNRLLEQIVIQAQQVTGADGGTLYLRTADEHLQFMIVRNTSLGIALGGVTGQAVNFAPLRLFDDQGAPNHSQIASRAALDGKMISVADIYTSRDFDFSGAKAFDERTGYRSQSILAIPLTGESGRVIGVLQLINARDSETGAIAPFEVDEVVESLGLLASAALAGYIREQSLREEINKLRIEVDLVKQAKEVAEITETDYFQQLAVKARQMRSKKAG